MYVYIYVCMYMYIHVCIMYMYMSGGPVSDQNYKKAKLEPKMGGS